jgi:hypothetical protein
MGLGASATLGRLYCALVSHDRNRADRSVRDAVTVHVQANYVAAGHEPNVQRAAAARIGCGSIAEQANAGLSDRGLMSARIQERLHVELVELIGDDRAGFDRQQKSRLGARGRGGR